MPARDDDLPAEPRVRPGEPRAVELLGYEESELLGFGLRDVARALDPGQSTAIVAETLSGTGAGGRFVKRFRRKDGALIWVRVSMRLVRNAAGEPLHFISQYEDITAEREATEARARLAAIVDSSYDAITTFALDGTITTWNAAAERIYGYPAEDVVGASAALLAPDAAGVDELRRALARAARGRRSAFESLLRRKDGTLVDVSSTGSPVRDADGAIGGLAAITRDVSDSKRVERELAREHQRLEQAEQIARMGSWDWDLQTDVLSWSAGLYRLMGVPHGTRSDRATTFSSGLCTPMTASPRAGCSSGR